MAVRDFSRDERVAKLPQRMIPLGPAVIFPLGLPGEVRGVMTAGQKIGAAPLAQPVVEMLSTFAVQAGIGLRLAGLRHDAERAALLADRDRIARDLHDLVIQRLFATGMTLQGAASLIPGAAAAERVQRAVDDLDDTIREIRGAIFRLQSRERPGAPALQARIVAVAQEMTDATGLEPWLRMDGRLDARVPPEIAGDLLAALREALSNVSRHARATHVDVSVEAATDLLLTVRDNGTGPGEAGPRSGLANLAQRASVRGGALRVEPAPDGGTELRWQVPLPA
jgi:signal transduction histidine kinase